MPFLLLMYLMLVCLPDDWPAPPVPLEPGECLGVVMAAMVGLAGATFVSAWRLRGWLLRHPGEEYQALRGYRRRRFYHQLALFVLFGLLVIGGWGWAVQTSFTVGGTLMPGAEAVVLAPFLFALIGSWLGFYESERAIYDSVGQSCWPRRVFLGYQLRNQLGMIGVPLCLLIAEKGLRRLFPAWQRDSWLSTAVGLAFLALVFLLMPWMLRLVLGLRPLPGGPLRDRLTAAARRLGFRFSDVLLWDTRHGVANAMVVGILPWLRYVLLTDRLVEELPPDEVEAVFGHEAGHVRHSHMMFYLGFLAASLVVVAGVWDALLALPIEDAPAAVQSAQAAARDDDAPGPDRPRALQDLLGAHKDLQLLPFLALLGGYIFVVFGFVSRRCERQADVFGCRAVSCADPHCQTHEDSTPRVPDGRALCPTGIRTFIRALDRVADLNGISRDRPGWMHSWQHSTIARRVEFLQRLLIDPRAEPRFQRAVAAVKWSFLAVLVVMLLVLLSVRGVAMPSGLGW